MPKFHVFECDKCQTRVENLGDRLPMNWVISTVEMGSNAIPSFLWCASCFKLIKQKFPLSEG